MAGSSPVPVPKTLHCVPRGPLLEKRYTSFIATTTSCASPKASHQLRFVNSLVSLGSLDHPLLVFRTFPTLRFLESFPTRCLDLYPGCLWSAFTRFFLQSIGLPQRGSRSALSHIPCNDFSTGTNFGAADFFMFRPPGLLATQVVPTAVILFVTWQPWRLLPSTV